MKRSRVGAAAATLGATGWLAVGAPLFLSPAGANTPLDWAEVSGVPLWHWLVLFAIPLGLFVLITVMVMGPAWARGERSASSGAELETWFGGPQRPSGQVEPADPAKASETGGASGRW